MASPRFRDTGRFVHRTTPAQNLSPRSLADLMRCLDPASKAAIPIRVRGAGTAATECNTAANGTVVDMTGLDRILRIDAHNNTVTAEAGVRLGTLARELAAHGLELIGTPDQTERTLGGALSSPCFGPGIGEQSACLSAQVIRMKVVTPVGKLMRITQQQTHLLSTFRSSYGALGVIYEATLRVRPIVTFTASHRSLSIDTFADVANRLAQHDVGIKFYLLPHKDRVYLDLRRFASEPKHAYDAPWKIKDWGESTVLPNVFKSLHRVVPIPSVRYRLVDTISMATHELVNTRFVENGSNAAGRRRRKTPSNLLYSTWCFPAGDFAIVAKAYSEFCRDALATSGYRCDLPAVGYRITRDNSALLSPSFDEPLIALQTVSTQASGWEDFVIDLAQFAENWGGIPTLSQTRSLRTDYARQVYGNRLEFFRRMRRKLDPEGRLLSPFLAQYVE